MAKTVPHK